MKNRVNLREDPELFFCAFCLICAGIFTNPSITGKLGRSIDPWASAKELNGVWAPLATDCDFPEKQLVIGSTGTATAFKAANNTIPALSHSDWWMKRYAWLTGQPVRQPHRENIYFAEWPRYNNFLYFEKIGEGVLKFEQLYLILKGGQGEANETGRRERLGDLAVTLQPGRLFYRCLGT
jgi:hypothetical protein